MGPRPRRTPSGPPPGHRDPRSRPRAICWAHYAPPIGDAFRKSYRRLLRWNDELPFVKFSVGEDERPLLLVEIPVAQAGVDALGVALARQVAVADRLHAETAPWPRPPAGPRIRHRPSGSTGPGPGSSPTTRRRSGSCWSRPSRCRPKRRPTRSRRPGPPAGVTGGGDRDCGRSRPTRGGSRAPSSRWSWPSPSRPRWQGCWRGGRARRVPGPDRRHECHVYRRAG